jgi:hypothetical protein
MIGRMYYACLENISVTNDPDQDVVQIVNGSTRKLVIHELSITSAQGVTAAELARLRLVRRSAAGTGGGTAATIEKADPDNDQASGVTSITPTVLTPGTISGTPFRGYQWSQQGEVLWLATPELRAYVPKSGILSVNLNNALGGTRVWTINLGWEEV